MCGLGGKLSIEVGILNRNERRQKTKTKRNNNNKKLATVKPVNGVQLFGTPWTVTHQAPLSMEFSRQEYWRGLSFPPPGDLPDPEIKPPSLASPALAGGFFFVGGGGF